MADSYGPTRLYRQGDVLVREVVALPADLHPVPRDEGRIILAYGEITGHAHAIDAPEAEATMLTADEEHRFLRLVSQATLAHEEHAPIAIPAGIYEVIRQRVWTDKAGDAEEAEENWRYAGD